MGDNFDEVEDILDQAEEISTENIESELVDKNFNESELLDIMAEIESLEKEFEVEALEVSSQDQEEICEEICEEVAVETGIKLVAPVEKKKDDLQNAIDQELEMSLKMLDEEIAIIEAAPKPIKFGKKPSNLNAQIAGSSSSSEVSFEASGQMSLNLAFKIGDEQAKLTIDPIKGLLITMSGVELCINQEDGCKVTMDSGVKFVIPMSINESLKKSA